jgi:hypothetical protein
LKRIIRTARKPAQPLKSRLLKNSDCRLVKKISEARLAFIVIVPEKRDREIGTNMITKHESERHD